MNLERGIHVSRERAYLDPGLLRQQPQAILKLVDAANRVPAAVEVDQCARFPFFFPSLPRAGVEDADRDCSVWSPDGSEFNGANGVNLVLGDGVDTEDAEVVGSLLRVRVCAAEVEVWV